MWDFSECVIVIVIVIGDKEPPSTQVEEVEGLCRCRRSPFLVSRRGAECSWFRTPVCRTFVSASVHVGSTSVAVCERVPLLSVHASGQQVARLRRDDGV